MLHRKFGLNIWHYRKFVFFLLMYTCCMFVIYIKVKIKKETPNCLVFNSTMLKKHWTFRNKIDHYLAKISKNISYFKDDPSGFWQLLAKSIYIYSSFAYKCQLKNKVIPCVKLIGATLSNETELDVATRSMKCIFKYGEKIVESGSFVLEAIPESHFKNYTAAYFFCYIKDGIPDYVSFQQSMNSNVTWVEVKHLKQESSKEVLISACIRPFYGNLSAIGFAEFLAYYSVMGVSHFYIYHTPSFVSLSSFLMILKQAKVETTLLNWNIPLNNEEIHEYGQIVFAQDCMTRSKYTFSHTVIIDIDEFIVPKSHNNLTTFVSDLDRMHKNAGSYIIQNVFFCDEYPVQSYSLLHIMMYQHRQATVWLHRYRSKYIIKPEFVEQTGIHEVWKYVPGKKEVLLPSSYALLNHYKSCCGVTQTWLLHLLDFYILDDAVVFDNRITKFHEVIYNHPVIKFLFETSTMDFEEIN